VSVTAQSASTVGTSQDAGSAGDAGAIVGAEQNAHGTPQGAPSAANEVVGGANGSSAYTPGLLGGAPSLLTGDLTLLTPPAGPLPVPYPNIGLPALSVPVSGLPVSQIVLRPDVVAGLSIAGSLGGPLVDIDLSLGWSPDGPSATPPAPPIPPDGLTAGHSGSSKPATPSAGGAALISWGSDGSSGLDALNGNPAGTSPDWLNSFLNHLGQNANPNANIRVRPSAS
jgi:hypothetical protein